MSNNKGPLDDIIPPNIILEGHEEPDNNIYFNIQDVEYMRISPEGFYIEGRYVTTDIDLYNAIRKFFLENPPQVDE